jgi:hypothetical protein
LGHSVRHVVFDIIPPVAPRFHHTPCTCDTGRKTLIFIARTLVVARKLLEDCLVCHAVQMEQRDGNSYAVSIENSKETTPTAFTVAHGQTLVLICGGIRIIGNLQVCHYSLLKSLMVLLISSKVPPLSSEDSPAIPFPVIQSRVKSFGCRAQASTSPNQAHTTSL